MILKEIIEYRLLNAFMWEQIKKEHKLSFHYNVNDY